MKRLFIILTLLCMVGVEADAQSWRDALKKGLTEAADKATKGAVTAIAINGTWRYSSPAVRLNSDNALTQVASSALSTTVNDKLAPIFEKLGVKEGFCTITFNADGTFSMPVKNKSLSGKYEFDSSTHMLTLKLGDKGLISVKGFAYISGSDLQMVFSIEKLTTLLTELGSQSNALAGISATLAKYKDVMLGFEFAK